MNKVILSGRPTKEPTIAIAGDKKIARFTLAVDRQFAKSEQKTDFIGCTAFTNKAEFCERYLTKGKKYLITGRIQTGSYTDKDNNKVYTTDVIVEDIEFCEKKESSGFDSINAPIETTDNGFMNIPEGIDDLPFN